MRLTITSVVSGSVVVVAAMFYVLSRPQTADAGAVVRFDIKVAWISASILLLPIFARSGLILRD